MAATLAESHMLENDRVDEAREGPASECADPPAHQEALATQLGYPTSQRHAREYNCLKAGPEGFTPMVVVLSDTHALNNKCVVEGGEGLAPKRADPPAHEEALVAQLGSLASQHHTSEYNCLKFGPEGCPVAYIPLCIQMPDHFKKLQDQQARYATTQAWWPSRRHSADKSAYADELVKTSMLCRPQLSPVQQEDLLNAISSSLTTRPASQPTAEPTPPIKTSHTHPLNISMMIPIELLPIISAHISRAEMHSPTVLDVPPSFQLHRLLSMPLTRRPPVRSSLELHSGLQPLRPTPHMQHTPRPTSTGLVDFFLNQRIVRKAIVSASTTKDGLGKPTTSYSVCFSSTVGARTAPSAHGSASNARHPRRNSFAPPPRRLPSSTFLTRDDPVGAGEKRESYLSRPPSAIYIDSSVYDGDRTRIAQHPRPRRMGNLFLSSCPGKKVRLNGPVNGRGGVCRNLRQDLRRMKDLGVGCVVCCLDDEELHYLGAPWEEYCRTADELDLDILRLPTPEGLAPFDVSTLDSHLDRLIERYTLRGITILVHCRGGVGRAGLVACCWTLKLGLCGWIETQPGVQLSRLSCTAPENLSSSPPADAEAVRRDTLQLVERVITLVRRRRSPKAVETFEQVRFLVDYVEFLRARTVPHDLRIGSVVSDIGAI